ncbi:MAG TPA: desulfoferrodoxin family protein [Spirochaetota bacterium]|nr:desulfoferrodoxin family protein [Spirochaetota bacterium]
MFHKNGIIITCFLAIALLLSASYLKANKSSVEIIVPSEASKGSVITIKINIHHNGNNRFHHTNWVYVKANDKEIARWDFTSKNLPGNENFSEEVQFTLNEDTKIEAMANCNLHGSSGPHTITIKAK